MATVQRRTPDFREGGKNGVIKEPPCQQAPDLSNVHLF
jgi:hypothetical protein